MRHFLKLYFFITLSSLWFSSFAQSPNILLIIADDVGVDPVPNYPPNAIKANMPKLETLMDQGLTFDNAWANPICSPTRATILTGKYGFRTNVVNVADMSQLSTDETSLHEYIDQASNGTYSSTIIGKWHLNGQMNQNPNYPGLLGIQDYAGLLGGAVNDYDDWSLTINGQTENSTEYITTKITDLAIDWINAQDKPWFCWLAYNAPHTPFHLPPDFMHSQGILPTDSASIANNPLPYYLAMIESVDYDMGRLMDNIPSDELDNTIIIFIGDNGTTGSVVQAPYVMNRAKGTLYQGGIHVPLVVSGAGVNRVNEREEALINMTDLFSTIVELTGTDLPQIHDSFSFADLLENGGEGPRHCMYSEVASDTPTSGWTARDHTYKLISFDNGQNRFYNLIDDPYEENNLLPGGLNAMEQASFDNLQNYFTSPCADPILDVVEDFKTSSALLKISPNPAHTELFLEWDNTKKQAYLIFDLMGRLVQTGELSPGRNNISIKELNAGLYVIKIDGLARKFIKA
jgi:arylsulfatase A-like enzyme